MAQKRRTRIEGDLAYVPLTQGYEAVVDLEDLPRVKAWSWSACVDRRADGSIRGVYAMRKCLVGGVYRRVRLHRQILDPGPGLLLDHVDGNGLNNRRSNLRPATPTENARNCARPVSNTSGVKGVTWHKAAQKWHARIVVDNETQHLGLFRCITAAAVAYAKASQKHHREFGRPC